MIKNRTFMMGLGAGLVLGALLLQLMLVGERSMTSGEEREWSKEQVVKAAESLNLQVVESSDELMTEEQWEENKKKKKNESQGTSAESPSRPSDAGTPESPKKPASPKISKSPADSPDPDAKEPSVPKDPTPAEIAYVIKRGNLADVAKGLQNAGVIKDKEAFIKAATAKGINKFIQQGTFYFTPGEDVNSIIAKISMKLPEKPSK